MLSAAAGSPGWAARAASFALSTTFFMSPGARNWPFLMFTGRPALAAAWMKSVCRHRNAGVCSTSTIAATCGTSSISWTSVSTGTPMVRFTSARISSPWSMPEPAEGLARAPVRLVVRRLVDEGDAELARRSPSARRRYRSRAGATRRRTDRRSGTGAGLDPASKPQSFMPRPRPASPARPGARSPPRRSS